MRIGLLVVTIFAVGTSASLGASETFTMFMDGSQEVPGPGDPDGSATGTITLDDTTGMISWEFTYSDIAAPTAMHIHTGAAGESGGVFIGLGVATSGGAGTLIDSFVHPTLSDVTDVLNDPAGFYVNIHNGEFGPGAVRGQVGQINKGDITVFLQTVATGLISPVHLTHAGDGSGRLFIVDQAGTIRIVKDGALLPTAFLDLTSEIPVLSTGFDERGVLGMAFHPDYASNGRFFVRYSVPRTGDASEPCFDTSRGCHSEVLGEFSVSGDPDVANPTGTVLFSIDEPQFNHDAGGVAFGPDGLLYFSLGDGGGAHDGLADDPPSHGPIGHGQDITTALGSMLRIDVDAAPRGVGPLYGIPSDNPFVGTTGLDEIYAYGFRNPFRFSFDDGPGGDGRLWLGDVGQNIFEELDDVVLGGNYGWVLREGAHCFDPLNPDDPPESCDTEGLIDPVAEYRQTDGGISIIGGYVYRGSRSPDVAGTYVFGDFSATFGEPGGRLYFIRDLSTGGDLIEELVIGPDDRDYGLYLKGLGEDEEGEVYVLGSSELAPTGTSGVVERLVLVGPCDTTSACPNTDVNCDDITDGFDIAEIRNSTNWLMAPADAGNPRADVNSDDLIDGFDIAVVRSGVCWLQ